MTLPEKPSSGDTSLRPSAPAKPAVSSLSPEDLLATGEQVRAALGSLQARQGARRPGRELPPGAEPADASAGPAHEQRRRHRIPVLPARPVFRPRPATPPAEPALAGADEQEDALREELLALLVQLQGAAPVPSVHLARQLAAVRDRLAALRTRAVWLPGTPDREE